MRSTVVFEFIFTTLALTGSSLAATFAFSTGAPDGALAASSILANPINGSPQKETADDFTLNATTEIYNISFTGLMPTDLGHVNLAAMGVGIYRAFPLDSANPPSGGVPTRNGTPSDVVFDSLQEGDFDWSFAILNSQFAVANTVFDLTAGGAGPTTGIEMRFELALQSPLVLPPGHYFFTPQLMITLRDFLWLSAPATASTNDYEACFRNSQTTPDWLRIGSDIIGSANSDAPVAYNMAFSLSGNIVEIPEPSSSSLLLYALIALIPLVKPAWDKARAM